MATREFPLVPEKAAKVETKYRRIATKIPVPESIATLRQLRNLEPRSMGGQPPVIWHRGEGVCVFDPYGNKWLDFSSGVLVTACGHGRPEIVEAIRKMADQGMYHAYCFPTEIRAQLVAKLTSLLPAPLKRVFLLTTGAEAVECCIKLARTFGMQAGGPRKNVLVTFENAFHGRTMGAQLAGGWPGLKTWIGGDDPSFVQVPFPDGFRQKDVSFEVFQEALAAKGVSADDVCGVLSETYQGCNAALMPPAYAQALRKWCDQHKAVMMLDEVQAGFGRTGAPFGFSRLGVVPDLAACGKGMELYGPGEMTSTHSANPICAAAALANLEVIEKEHLIENAARLSVVLAEGCRRIAEAARGRIGHWDSTGLVGAVQFTRPGTTDPDPEPAWEMVLRAVRQGVMLFAPVGVGGCAIKVNPPLVINEEALREGLDVLVGVAASL